MTFFVVTFVGRVDDQGRPVLLPEGGKPAVKEIHVWDERTEQQIAHDYRDSGVLHFRTVGYQHTKGRPLEWRRTATIFAPHLIAVRVDTGAEMKQPDGPVEFLERPRVAE